MSSIHKDKTASLMQKHIHRIFHEIEERTDTNVDKVADIIGLWENWRIANLRKEKK